MKNIPGIISIGYAPAINFNLPASIKHHETIALSEVLFTFLDIVPESGNASDDLKESAAGSFYNSEVTFQVSPVNNALLTVFYGLKQPYLYYIKTVSGNYLLGINNQLYAKFSYSEFTDKKASGFVGASCKLTMNSLCGMIRIV